MAKQLFYGGHFENPKWRPCKHCFSDCSCYDLPWFWTEKIQIKKLI